MRLKELNYLAVKEKDYILYMFDNLLQNFKAKLADVHYTNLGKYERGKASPSAGVLQRIAQALELSPDFLINGTLEDKAGASITD